MDQTNFTMRPVKMMKIYGYVVMAKLYDCTTSGGGGTNKVNTDQVRKLSLRNGIDNDWISSLY